METNMVPLDRAPAITAKDMDTTKVSSAQYQAAIRSHRPSTSSSSNKPDVRIPAARHLNNPALHGSTRLEALPLAVTTTTLSGPQHSDFTRAAVPRLP